LVQLKDPTRIGELVADCDRALPGIPGVAAYSCGVPLDMGRSNVTKDYDVGIYVGFADASAYRGYLDDPRHLALVEEWRDGWKAVRIFDVLAGDPAAVQAVTASRTAPPPAEVPAPKPAAPASTPAPAPAAPTSAAPASSAPPSAAPASAAPPSAAPAAPPRAAPPAAGAAAPAAPKR
ncbi:MAG: Dabb family protein, partial [Planctomycetota bacterium]